MLKKVLMVGSALGLATILSMGVSNAQDQPVQPEKKMERSNDCANNEDCVQGGQKRLRGNDDNDNQMGNVEQQDGSVRKKKRLRGNDDNDNQMGNVEEQDQGSSRKKKRLRAESDDMDVQQGDNNRRERREARRDRDWNYDSNRHRRSRNRDATFRFYFGGYYYPERYWDEPVVVLSTRGRVSCGEGRRIVDNSGFNRVRTVECSGRNYTYMGRRYGDTFRIVLNSRNGRIVSAREL